MLISDVPETMAPVVVGIDAGGSTTRARALAGGRVIFEGRGGPGNPLAARPETLAASYQAALAGCPPPSHLAACVSGAGGSQQRAHVDKLLAGRFPAALIQVVPDYVAAMLAAPSGTNVVVIAGTGSVVCSRGPDGEYRVSGGRGWILGDRGSAARLGQAALEWFCQEDPDPGLTGQVQDLLGLTGWRQIAGALSASKNPAALLARAAPILTGAAENGSVWAAPRLKAEMGALAATTVLHVERHQRGTGQTRLALAGGVWQSPAARAAFMAVLPPDLEVAPECLAGPLDPLDGAIRLAASLASEHEG
jgi:N-acetylglucosamine kinase-like BadF-type ATPase